METLETIKEQYFDGRFVEIYNIEGQELKISSYGILLNGSKIVTGNSQISGGVKKALLKAEQPLNKMEKKAVKTFFELKGYQAIF